MGIIVSSRGRFVHNQVLYLDGNASPTTLHLDPKAAPTVEPGCYSNYTDGTAATTCHDDQPYDTRESMARGFDRGTES